ncbi:aromatic ring-hydroxylating oxygenase subunit alpha [Candidatus Spongiihabitans sp.]|uniref:aromatic ring-hydroxylating oxygenase subunit alpha n=1 Tax=Candidatus Spongiihabitans sp. TaxID=3101308 RepID=UPI003C7B30D1
MPSGDNAKPVQTRINSETSDCLAPWAYYDDELLELEKDHLFKKNWLLVGHINDMPNPRDYLTLDAVGERALVVRGNDNQIRAFHNVCRHRGAKLLDSPCGQCAPALTCPFHGWTYQLDGKLIGVPAENTFRNLDKSRNGLVPLDLEVWMGFIFIRFQGGKQSLAEMLRPMQDEIAAYKIAQMQPLENTRYDDIRPYNWKVFHDIDNEGYHVPIGHPALQQLYGKDYSDHLVGGVPLSYGVINAEPAKLWSVRHYQKLLPRFAHLPKKNQDCWLYGGIFPSMVLGLYPDSIEFYMTIPVAIDKTRVRGGCYALLDSRREARAVRYLNRRINNATSAEDDNFVRWLQDGMQSSVFPQPNLSSIEQGVREFHHRLQATLPVARLKHHPGTGKVAQANLRLS